MQTQKSLTLSWRSNSQWGSDRVACWFAHKGSQYNGYATQRLNQFTITLLTTPKIVDAELKLICKMR